MATPLKLKDANGNIQELTTTEENYIAYQVGLHLSTADSAEVGSLNRATTGDTVGTYSNTFFNQAVGTHPSTSITTGTTNTVIYQTTGTAAETDSDVFRPIMWVDSGSQTGFKMMPDVDLNAAVDRYLSKIFTNEYPGSYRLSTSAPSGDWAEQQTAFIDTRTDGASIAHKLWKRTGGTAPTAVKPMRLKNEASFAGVQEMSDAEIKFSFGQRAKTRIAASKIGSYQLRNSSQGAPTDTGTWVAKGTATDTKNTTANQAFTRDSTVNFQESYTTSYTTGYATNYTSITDVGYTSTYTRIFDQGYSRDFTGGFNQGYTSTFTGSFNQNYDRQFLGVYDRLFQRINNTQYERQFTGQFSRNYAGTTPRNYTRLFSGNFVGQRNTGSFAAFYQRVFTRFQGANYYSRDFVGSFSGAVGSNYETQYLGQFTSFFGPNYYSGNQAANYNRVTQTSFFSGSTRAGQNINYQGNQEPAYDSSITQQFDNQFSQFYTRNVGVTYSRNFTAAYELQTQPINYGNAYLRNFTRLTDTAYQRNININYLGVTSANYITQYEGQYTRQYAVLYIGDYTGSFGTNYTASYTTSYSRTFDGAVYTTTYDRAFTGVYTTSYEGAFDAAYTIAYEGNYENIYDKSFDTSYITDYLGNFQGNFEGETIQSANATNETYTLYVRIS